VAAARTVLPAERTDAAWVRTGMRPWPPDARALAPALPDACRRRSGTLRRARAFFRWTL